MDDRVIDTDDPESLRAEIQEFGSRHLRWLLRQCGLATEIESQRFNRCDHLVNCIDVQFDSGRLSSGVRKTFSCPALGLEWSEEWG